jgi:predicted S18 family serine protease
MSRFCIEYKSTSHIRHSDTLHLYYIFQALLQAQQRVVETEEELKSGRGAWEEERAARVAASASLAAAEAALETAHLELSLNMSRENVENGNEKNIHDMQVCRLLRFRMYLVIHDRGMLTSKHT